MPLYPRPQIPLVTATRDLPMWGRSRATGGFSTGGLNPLTCPPAAAPRGQAAFATKSQKPLLHSNQPFTGAPPPLPCAAGRRMRNSTRTPTSGVCLQLPQRKAAAVTGNLTGRRVFCLCKLPKLKRFKNTSQRQEGDRACASLLSQKVFVE